MAKAATIGMTSRQIRAAMLGATVPGLRIHRQAWRVTDGDSDELVLVTVSDGSWWAARRLSDRLSVWAYATEDLAWDAFDRLLGGGPAWREAAAEPIAS